MLLRSILLLSGCLAAALTPCVSQEAAATSAGDRIRELCEQGEKHLGAWELPAAKSAFLRAITVQDEQGGESPKTARPYLGLASVSLRRGEYCRAVACYELAARKCALSLRPFSATIDGLAVVFDLPAVSPTSPILSHLGHDLGKVLSPDLRGAFEGIATRGGPSEKAGQRWAEATIETARRVADQEQDLVFALAVIDAGRTVLEQHATPATSADVKKALSDLGENAAEYGKRATEATVAAAGRLSIPCDATNVPEHPAFAFRLGEAHRLRWRADPGAEALARDAEACYRRCLSREPDHWSAALGLADILYRTDRHEEAIETMQTVVRTLLEPSQAWTGAPERSPAPRYDTAIIPVELFTTGLAGPDASPDLTRLWRWADNAVLGAYLEHRPRFHPEDAATSRNDLYVRTENNAGFRLLQNWDLARAAQFLRRSVHLAEQKDEPFPVALQNLGHLHYLQGDFDRALEYYRKSFQDDPTNPVAANNLGALMGIFAAITGNINLVQEGHEYYRRAVELAPRYVYAKQSEDFMRRVYLTWSRYLQHGDRSPEVVWSFGNSFFYAAKSISEADDPKYLQAMQILDSGLRLLPGDEEMEKIFEKPLTIPLPPTGKDGEARLEPGEVKHEMAERFQVCFEKAVPKYEGLLREHGDDNPDLNFLLGEAYRIAWRRSHEDAHRDRALAAYRKALTHAPDHAAAARGLAELLRSMDREDEALERLEAVTAELLKPSRPWEGEPEVAARPRVREAVELAKRAAGDVTAKDTRLQALLQRTTLAAIDAQTEHAESVDEGRDAEAWNNLGYLEVLGAEILDDPSHLERALEALDRSLELDPHRPGPVLNKIHTLKALGRTAEAEKLRAEMRTRLPRDPRFAPNPPTPKRTRWL